MATEKLALILVVFLIASSSCAVLQVHARFDLSPHNIKERHVDAATFEEDTIGAANECQYLIVTKTGDMLGAGTDAEFTIKFWDASNNTFSIVVDGNGGPFEQKAFTKIEPFTKKCMNPCRIKITSTNWFGAGPAWFLEWIKVTVTGQGRSTYWHKFNWNQWVGPFGDVPREVNMNECYGGVAASRENRLSSFSIV